MEDGASEVDEEDGATYTDVLEALLLLGDCLTWLNCAGASVVVAEGAAAVLDSSALT